MVMIRKIMSLALMAVLIFPPLAVAADPPVLKGRWIGKTHSIIAGKGGHWPTSSGTFEKPLLAEKDLVIEITGQQGRRFWGVQTLSGSGEKTEEQAARARPSNSSSNALASWSNPVGATSM